MASPLGLRMIIGGEGDKERDFDYLSSLEIIIVDQMDVFLMQNWDHLLVGINGCGHDTLVCCDNIFNVLHVPCSMYLNTFIYNPKMGMALTFRELGSGH